MPIERVFIVCFLSLSHSLFLAQNFFAVSYSKIKEKKQFFYQSSFLAASFALLSSVIKMHARPLLL